MNEILTRLLGALGRLTSEERRRQVTREKVLREALEQDLRFREEEAESPETGMKSRDTLG